MEAHHFVSGPNTGTYSGLRRKKNVKVFERQIFFNVLFFYLNDPNRGNYGSVIQKDDNITRLYIHYVYESKLLLGYQKPSTRKLLPD